MAAMQRVDGTKIGMETKKPSRGSCLGFCKRRRHKADKLTIRTKKNVDLPGLSNWEWVVKQSARNSFAGNWVDQWYKEPWVSSF